MQQMTGPGHYKSLVGLVRARDSIYSGVFPSTRVAPGLHVNNFSLQRSPLLSASTRLSLAEVAQVGVVPRRVHHHLCEVPAFRHFGLTSGLLQNPGYFRVTLRNPGFCLKTRLLPESPEFLKRPYFSGRLWSSLETLPFSAC